MTHRVLSLLLPALVALIAYLPAWTAGAVWDDTTLLQPEVLGAAWAPLPFSPNYFRPLGVLSLRWTQDLFAHPLAAHHVLNALLHALNTALVAALLGLTLRAPPDPPCLLLPLLYGLHPALVEGVAFVSSRFDLLMTTGLLLALLADLSPHLPRRLRPPLVALAFLFAALSKEAAATFPLILAAAHLALGLSPRQRWTSHLAVGLAALLYLGLRINALGSLALSSQEDTLPTGSPLAHLLLVARSLEQYLLLVLWPFGTLSPVHFADLPLSLSPTSARALLVSTLALVALAVQVRRQPASGAWLLAGLAALLPALNLLPLQLTGGAFVAERYLVAPLAFLALGAAVALRPALDWHQHPLALSSITLWLAAAFVSLQTTSAHWYSQETLWEWGLTAAPRSSLPPINLSELHNRSGDPSRGLLLAAEAIRREPDAPLAWNNQGQAQFLLGHFADAARSFRHAAQLDPETPYFWSNLGAALQEQGLLSEAEAVLRQKALPLDPGNPDAALNLAGVYLKAGRVDQALEQIEGVLLRQDHPRALALQQEALLPDAWMRLADIRRAQKDLPGALQALDRARDLGASPVDVVVSQSSILIAAGRPAEAADLLRQTLPLAPQDARLPYTMGIAAAIDGATPDARDWFRRASALDPSWDAPRQQLDALPE